MDFKLINLCDHEVTIRDCNGKLHTLPPCQGEPARVRDDYVSVFYLGTISISRRMNAMTTNLPLTTEGVMYVVSRVVAMANRGRKDLLIPGAQVYTDDGIRCCSGLEIL